jgi:hypothetical protein
MSSLQEELGLSKAVNFLFGDKVREGLTLVGVFPAGTTVTRSERDSVAKKKFFESKVCKARAISFQ